MICPNKNHPDWALLVNKVGEIGAYKAFIKNGNNIPSIDDINELESIQSIDFLESVSQLKHNEYFLKEQNDIVDSLTQAALNIYEEARLEGEVVNEKEAIKRMFDSLPDLAEDYTAQGDSELAGRINKILELLDETDTFIGFKQLVSNKIKSINFDMSEELDYSDTITSGEVYDQSNMERDPESKMSPQVKRFFTFIPVIDENGNTESNYLGLEKFYDFKKIYKSTLSTVANLSPYEIEDRLKELVDTNLMYKSLYLQFVELTTSEKNAIISTLTKQTTDLKLVRFWPAEQGKQISGEVINSNQEVAEEAIVDEWEANFNDKINHKINGVNLFEEKVTDTNYKYYHVNPEAGTILLNRYQDVRRSYNLSKTDEDKVKSLVGLSELFDEIGVKVSVNALYHILKSERFGFVKSTSSNTLDVELVEIFKALANKVNLESRTEDNDINNIYNNTGENNNAQFTRLRALAQAENKFSVQKQTGAFTNGEGNTVYPFVERHYLNFTFNDIKNQKSDLVSDLRNDTFSGTSTWLFKLSSSKFKDNFGLFYADTTKNGKKKNRFGKKYEDLSVKEKNLTRYILFQNSGRDQGLYVYPAPSDKTTFPLIGALKSTLEFKDNIVSVEQIDIESEAFKDLTSLMISEVSRVNKTILEIKENKFKIKGYHDEEKTGKRFLLFPHLNEKFKDNIDSEEIIFEGNDFKELMINEVKYYLTERFKKEEKTLTKEGIVINNFKQHMFDKSYMLKLDRFTSTENKVKYAMFDYIINDTIALGNIYQLFTGDPAMLATKKVGNKEDSKSIVNRTITNVFKRIAKDIAPGREGVFTSPTYKTIFINEPKSNSKIGEKSEEWPHENSKLAEAYSKLDAADAQEWVLVEEYVDTLFAYGEIGQNRYDAIKAKLKDGQELSPEEIGIVLQPIKPVYTWRQKRSDVDPLMVTYYIKTSAFPLIPQLVKNTSLSNLYTLMKENNIQRAVVESGVKAGFSDPITVFEDDGLTVKDLDGDGGLRSQIASNPNTIKTLSRKGFRIQQEVPYKAEKNEILLGTQFAKLIFANLNPSWEFNDKKGYELKQEADSLIGQMIEKKVKAFKEEFKIDENGVIHDVDNFVKAVEDMAVEKGFNYNDVFQLKTVERNGKKVFEINPFFNTRYKEIESIFTALISNRITKRKLPGRSYVQGSSVGFNTLKDQGIEKISINTKVEGIVWTENRKDKDQLDYRIDSNGGIYAEILVPFHFFNDEGKLLKLEDYVNKDGSLDTKRFDTRLLEKIGYRIPTQGHMSMVKFKIVGFLPQNSGDLMIVPAAITKQMGSDFDVDKVYAHGFFTKMVGNKVTKNEEDIENKIIDIYKSILESKNTKGLVTKTLSADPLNDAVKDVEQLKVSVKSENLGLLDRSLNDEQISKNRDGKILIGISSLSSTHHALSQHANLYLVQNENFKPVSFKNEQGVVYTDEPTGNNVNNYTEYSKHPVSGSWRLDKVYGYESISGHSLPILDIIAYVQTAATDNAKDPILGRGNINKHTANVALLIARSGFDENWIVNFTMQDIIVELSEKLNNELDDLTDMSFVSDKKKVIIQSLKDKYFSKFMENGGKIEDVVEYTFSFKELHDLNSVVEKNKDYYLKQLQILNNFLNWDITAQELGKLQNATNFETKGLGKDLYSVKSKIESISKTDLVERKNPAFKNANKLTEDTTIGHLMKHGLFFANSLYNNKEMYPYNGTTFNDIYNNIKSNSLYKDRDILSDDFAETINENIRFAIFNQIGDDLFQSDKKYLMYELGSKIIKLKAELPQNLFLNKLSIKKPVNNTDPTLITYNNSSKAEEIESLNASIAWLELYKNEDTKEIAIDLVKYAYSIGFERSMNDFGRFLPYDMMKELGIIDAINEVSIDNMFGAEVLNNFIVQFFQHNPESGIQFNKADIVDNGDKSFSISNSKLDNYKIAEQEGQIILPLVVTQYEKENGKKKSVIKVYYNTGVNHYVRVDNLGSTGINEYNLTDNFGTSILKANQTGTTITKSNEVVPVTNVSKVAIIEEVKNEYVEQNIAEPLAKIAKGTEKDSSYQSLAEYFLINHSDQIQSIKFEKKPLDLDIRGMFDPNTGTISVNSKNPENFTKKGYKEAIIHETVHGLTSITINDYYSGKILTADKVRAIKELELTIKQLKVLYEKGVKVDSSLNAKLGSILSSETPKAVKELVAEAFANDQLKVWLNTVKSPSRNESFWDKFKRIISKILGINVVSDSVLASVVSNALELMQNGKTRTSDRQEIDTKDLMKSDKYKDKKDVFDRIVKPLMVQGKYFEPKGDKFFAINGRERAAFALLEKMNSSFIHVGKLFTMKTVPIAKPAAKRDEVWELVINEDILKKYNDSFDNLFGADYLVSTTLTKYERMIQNLQGQIKVLEKRKSEGRTDYGEIQSKINTLNERIKALNSKFTDENLLNQAKGQISSVKQSINSINLKLSLDLTSSDLLKIMSDLEENFFAVEGWRDLEDLVDFEKGSSNKEVWTKIKGELDDLHRDYLDALSRAYIKFNNEALGSNQSKEDLFKSTFDTGAMEKNFLDISVSDNALLKSVYEIINRASRDVNQEFISKNKKIDEIFDKIEKVTGKKGLLASDIFLQKDEKGKWNGAFIQPFKKEFFDVRANKYKKAKADGSWKEYFDFIRDNQIEMTQEDYETKSSKFTAEEYERQDYYIEKYNNLEIAQKEKYESLKQQVEWQFQNEEITEKEKKEKLDLIERELLTWINNNSPYNYWSSKYKKSSNNFIVHKPIKKWEDPRFNAIKSNPSLLAVYKELKDLLYDNNKMIPRSGQPIYHLPELSKTFVEKLKENGTMSVLSSMNDWMKDLVSENIESAKESEIRIGSNVIKTIPVNMMSDRLALENKSRDLKAILKAHSATSLHYKHMSKIQPVINASERLIKEMVSNEEVAGKKVINMFGNNVEIKGGLVNTKEQLEYFVDVNLYKRTKEQEGVQKSKTYSTEDKKKIKELDSKLEKNEITKSQYDDLKSQLGKNVTISKIGDAIISLNYMQALALNPVSAIVNGSFGIITNLTHAAGKEDFDTNSAMQALGIMLSSLSQTVSKDKLKSAQAEKLYAWSEKLGLFHDMTDGAISKKIADKVMKMQSKSEFLAQGQSMVATLIYQKLKDKNGNEVSVWNAYKVVKGELVWDSDKMGQMEEPKVNELFSENRKGVNMYKLATRIQQMNKFLHGNYKDPILFKKTIVGRAVMLFRTWIPYTMMERFGKEYYDNSLGRDKKGRYRTVADIFGKEKLGALVRILKGQLFLDNTTGIEKRVDIENLRKFNAEIRTMLVLLGIVMMLSSALDDEDDEELKSMLTMALNSTNRLYSDMTFFINPKATNQILRNAIPITKTLTDIVDLLGAVPQLIAGKDEYKSGPRKGRSKIIKEVNDIIPIVNQYDKIISSSNYVYDKLK